MTLDYRPVRTPARRNARRGFTLIELMVVVIIITALASLAIPSILRQMRDRRTRQAAEEIAALYRQARLRALGRGAAVMVRYKSDTGFQLREGVVGGAGTCARLPATSCQTTKWGQGPGVANGDQEITTFNPNSGVYDGVTVQAYAGDPSTGGGSAEYGASNQGTLDICFTPMGGTFFRIANGATLSRMTGIPAISVGRAGGLTRVIIIPPNGLARTDVAQ